MSAPDTAAWLEGLNRRLMDNRARRTVLPDNIWRLPVAAKRFHDITIPYITYHESKADREDS